MSETIAGGCLCGEVRYECQGDDAERQLMMMNVFRKSDDGIFHSLGYDLAIMDHL
jgi:hypothetical protein